MTVLEIDGSYGEGGGQTVRIASSFAIILNQSIHVSNVRAGRRIPGLRPQHAATLRILRDICGGSLEGGEIGSTEFTFVPGRPRSGSLSIDLGTAASITLVLQALVPAVSISGVSLELRLIGGTDVLWSPTSDYLQTVLSASMRLAGIDFSLDVEKRGYYPNGGGRARASIKASASVIPLDLSSRVGNPPITIVSRAGMLPRRVAEQQLSSAKSQLERNGLHAYVTEARSEDSVSPGSSIIVSSIGSGCFMGADSIGARGKPAVRVGAEAGGRFARSYLSGACVDPHLADMLAPLLFLAKGKSKLLTSDVTEHLRSGLHVAGQFVRDAQYSIGSSGKAWLVEIISQGESK